MFHFHHFIKQLYLTANVTLNDDDIFNIAEFDVLKHISILIHKESPRTLQNYLIWYFIMDFIPFKYQSIKQQFDQIFNGISSEKKRKIECIHSSNHFMGLALSK